MIYTLITQFVVGLVRVAACLCIALSKQNKHGALPEFRVCKVGLSFGGACDERQVSRRVRLLHHEVQVELREHLPEVLVEEVGAIHSLHEARLEHEAVRERVERLVLHRLLRRRAIQLQDHAVGVVENGFP